MPGSVMMVAIGVNENDLIPHRFKSLACLGSGVIKFACLTDDYWTGTDDQNSINTGNLFS